jgi:putative oxidoreductase
MPKDFWPVNNMGDAAILYCFIFLYFVFRGPGALSIDGDTRAIVASSD